MASIEEENEQLKQNNAACESVLEGKHMAMLNRLAANHDTRLEKSAAWRAGTAAKASPLESVDQFLQAFSEHRGQVEEGLASIQERKSCLPLEADKSSINMDLDKLALKVSEIEKFVADRSYFLPAYEVRASQSVIASLRDKIEAAHLELLPKRKFSFKNKTGKDRKILSESQEGTIKSVSVKEEDANNKQKSSCLERTLSSFGVQNAQNVVVARDLQDHENGEYTLENLVNCKVYLRGRCRALYIHKLQGCHVYAGPVTGSSLIEEVTDSVLMLASHQIRIHQTKTTDLYLRVRSRPIVEHTSDLRFAPYAFYYYGIEDDLFAANLLEETGLWKKVDDF